ncbi:isoleucine--tRNA ligase [Actinorhabdospora filicis]|uniref:Isoleucine--tRNA ligase n=1 Tax=Actinorhabdospora filicis TaxID=1785913 RepID=A0A9W6SRW4_9ACTN|nr:isoleucine--tRNA ligase [Actinorhabdospora filicis]GLZ81790.1 isoleucine--tRNA ligase [Actinorhabdospora filicis]
MPYPKDDPQRGVPASPKLPEVEQRILDFWGADGTFQASIDRRPAGSDGSNEFVFYDGPPFANGLPHYGHLLTGYIKDVVPRYQTMRGRRVERRFGWDCHGLPAEVEAEKQLGINTKAEIMALGVGKFNEAVRESVFRYTGEWERYVTRQARWVDFANDYKTLDLDYMESVMWAFKTLYDKGLIYEGYRVLAYCWRCETPLSNTETRMDDVYRDRTDPALTVGFQLESGEKLLVWTTTPWTLPSNLAAAVGPDLDYVVVEQDGRRYVLGKTRLAAYAKELGEATVVAELKGRDLVGRKYTPLFDYLADTPNAFQVIGADFVSDEDGTGVVHMAPAFGEDDQNACASVGIPTVMTVDEHTRFTAIVPDYQGVQVFDANKPIVRELKERGDVVLRHEGYTHSYPHCWRCDTPLVYKAVSSWFVAVTTFRDRMVELNRGITWTPEHIKDGQFGKWLEGARDWSISRNRFWGSPIPVWVSDDPNYPRVDVYGSLDELERDFGVRPADLHRPFIDDLTRPNPDDPTGNSTMRRVPEVLDCWFESGSMPYAQVHYPFENREWFENHYPGDFIVEYTPQTRGWFYTMHVLATALFDRPAFRDCVVHGTLLGDDGRKMSKSLRNYPDVYEVFDTYGADAMRWLLISSPVVRGGDMIVSESGIRDAVRQVVLPLWNVWYFFSLYANAEGYDATPHAARTGALASDHLLDRYVLAKTDDLVEGVRQSMDAFDLSGAAAQVRSYLDALTNWYVRRSRDRFWQGDRRAFDVLATVLETVCRVAAPLLPLVTEDVWRGLTGGRSVHLVDWPETAGAADPALVSTMDAVREVCSAALSLRKATRRRVRLPLATLTVAGPGVEELRPYAELIADEVNVKEVVFTGDLGEYCTQTLSLVPRALGPRLGKDVQRVIKAHKSGDWSIVDGAVTVGGVELQDGEYELTMLVTAADRTAALPGGGVVVLDTDVTPELAAEGLARDVVRVIQTARRDADLAVTDRITVVADLPEDARAAVETHREFVTGETLTRELGYTELGDEAFRGEIGEGVAVRVLVKRTDG